MSVIIPTILQAIFIFVVFAQILQFHQRLLNPKLLQANSSVGAKNVLIYIMLKVKPV